MPHTAVSYSKPGDSMKQFNKSRYRTLVYLVVIPVALLYSFVCCITNISNAISRQLEIHLLQNVWEAQMSILEAEGRIDPVYLRRDRNNQITAITVDGILLNQFQAQYSQYLYKKAPSCLIQLKAKDILGNLFFWIPGSVSLYVRPDIHWDVKVCSRTFYQDTTTRCFQIILTTAGENRSIFSRLKIQEELVLYEALLYS
jgi:hypothetical protein